ncbi:MAG: extracellular solute-binding protein [Actinomycetota bacterium]|nr:extracellular solute-binding protein [Actinomycetota bacterium]
MARALALGVVLTLVAACGSSDDSDDEAAPAADTGSDSSTDEDTAASDDGDTAGDGAAEEGESDGERVTIRFTWWGNPERDELTGQMIDAFMEEHPDIEVVAEPSVFDGYFDKLAVAFPAGDAPDVMTLGGSYPTEYGGNGVLLDLNEVADTVGLDQYEPNTYSAAELDGAVYGLPTGGNTLGLLVNLDLVEQAGVELPDDSSWTWDDFVTFAGDLSAGLPEDTYGTDWRIQEVKGTYAAQRDKPLYLAEGGIGVDVATMTDLFELPRRLMDNGGMPSAEQTTELVGTTMEQTLFGQGRAATMFAYSNQLQNFADILGAPLEILNFPGETEFESPGLTVLPSQFFSIYAESDHPDEAAMLIDWLLNEPAPAEIILANRGLSFNPTIREAITPLLPEYEQRSAEFLGMVASEGGPSLPPPSEGQGEVDDMTLRLEADVLFGSLSPEEAAEQWVSEATAIVP